MGLKFLQSLWRQTENTPRLRSIKPKEVRNIIADFFGKTALAGSSGYTGSDGAGPTEEVFYHIWCGSATQRYQVSGLVTPVSAYLEVEYDVTFTDPHVLPAS